MEVTGLSHIPVLDVTDQVSLRAMKVTDAKDFFGYTANPQVGKYVLVDRLASVEEARKEIEYRAELFRNQRALHWAIVNKDDQMIGWIGFYLNTYARRAEIAYELSESYWNQGIMTEAMATVTRYGFKMMNLIRIEAIILKQNIASDKLLQSNGYIHEGCLHDYKYYRSQAYDVELYAQTKKMYAARRNQESKESKKNIANQTVAS